MSDQDLKDELERLRKENAALKKGASSTIRMKVSEKGAVSIYGMGRFLVTSAAVTDGAWAAAVGAAPGHPREGSGSLNA